MIRAFIAIELSKSIQQEITDLQTSLQDTLSGMPIRWVPVENIHLTLKFLGDMPEDAIRPILEALSEVSMDYQPFSFQVSELGCFPRPQRPRVLWLGVKDSSKSLDRLQKDLDLALQALEFESEKRRFHPHLTLGRVKKSARPDEILAISDQFVAIPSPKLGTQQVDRIDLIQSRLTPSGAVYNRLGHAALG